MNLTSVCLVTDKKNKHTWFIINNHISVNHDYNEKGELELIPVHRIPASLNPLIIMEGLASLPGTRSAARAG